MKSAPAISPNRGEDVPTATTVCGYPILIRVTDPSAAGPETTLVDPPSAEPKPTPTTPDVLADTDDSVNFPANDESLLASLPLDDSDRQLVEPAEPVPSYLKRDAQSRQQTIQKGKFTNRLYLGGMAISLLIASYWVFTSGGNSNSQSADPNLVDLDEMEEAPPWPGDTTPAPSEAIVVEPLDNPAPAIAAQSNPLPSMQPSSAGTSANPVELTKIVPAYAAESNIVPNNTVINPAGMASDQAPPPLTGDYVPSFGPAGNSVPPMTPQVATLPQREPRSAASSGESNFSFGPASTPRDSTAGMYQSTAGSSQLQSPAMASPTPTAGHWALDDGKLRQQEELPVVIHGPLGGAQPTYSQPEHAPQLAGDSTSGGFSFNPRNTGYPPQPSEQTDGMTPRSASRARLSGSIESFDVGTR